MAGSGARGSGARGVDAGAAAGGEARLVDWPPGITTVTL